MNTSRNCSRRELLQAAALASGSGLPGAWAQSAPEMNLAKIILGSPAGTLMDLFVRRIADAIQPAYARNVIVDNRVGAAGQISISAVKAAAPDGTTILAVPSPLMYLYPFVYRKLPYDPIADFTPVGLGAVFDVAFAVGPMVPASVKTMPEFFAWCKANPAQANFGSPATASTLHFVGSMAARAAGVDLTHVPFRGTTPAILDMIGGQVAAVCAPVGDFMPFLDGGKCRILGTTGDKRSRFVPTVPTFVEQGYKDIVVSDWFGFFVPAKTPAAHVQRLNAAIRSALATPAVMKTLQERGLEPHGSTPEQLAARLKADMARWQVIAKSFNFTVES
ncbi:MAG: Twin-arginine translocation pathway signal protein [Polaromonas sp.]|nr:Twin-arginine translocation pathway signal protein [Polaromonas sp.]